MYTTTKCLAGSCWVWIGWTALTAVILAEPRNTSKDPILVPVVMEAQPETTAKRFPPLVIQPDRYLNPVFETRTKDTPRGQAELNNPFVYLFRVLFLFLLS